MQRFEPTEQQRAVIGHRDGHALVFAGPGTGKTETLARRFASLVVDDGVDPSAILVLTFSRRAAEQMLERVVQRLRERTGHELAVSELFVRTFHSFCARLLDGDGPRFRERNLLSPIKERLLWKRVAARVPLRSFDPEVRTSPAFAADALNLIAQLKGQGLSPSDVEDAARRDGRLHDIAALYRELDAERRRLRLSDFRDLVKDALDALVEADSPASRWLRARGGFAHVLVDEFQDSDALQLRLLEILAGPDRNSAHPVPEICFVGDFNQSIYRFRGATPKNIEIVRESFACRELTLDLNRRSAQAILDVANATPQLKPESLTQAENRSLEGSVMLRRATDPDNEIALVCDSIAARVAAGTSPGEIAVLLRVSEPYQSLIVGQLDARGIPVAARPSAGFLEDPVIAAVLDTIRLTEDFEDFDRWTRVLTNPLIGFRQLSVSLAFDAARRFGVRNAFVALRDNPPSGRLAFEDFLRRWRAVEAEARSGESDIASLIATIAREFELLRPVLSGALPPGWDPRSSPARLGSLVDAARDLQSMAYVLGDGRIKPAQFVDSIEEIAGLLGDPTQTPLDSGGVRVMSIHAAKGLEFDEVIIPQAVDGVLPQRERGHALLSNASVRALQTKTPTFVATPEEAYQEECSLWYVALTRARRHVLVTAAEADADDIELPLSVFAHAIKDAADAREPSLAPTPELRSGASSRSGTTFDQVQARRPLTHVIDHLSPTGVGTFLACPRRFFYKEVLRLAQDSDDEGTVLGRLLHRALAEFHAQERAFGPRPDLEACRARWSDKLSTLAEPAAGLAAAEAGFAPDSSFMRYQLALARQYLRDYAAHLARESIAAPFEVLACEQRLEAQIGGVLFTGQADRIDRLADGTLAIRDYKSGRRYGWLAPAVRKALERIDRREQLAGDAPEGLNLQLLLYMPGAQALFGAPVSRVEFIYFRGEGEGDGLLADTVSIVADGARASDNALTHAEAQRAQTEIAASVAAACADGSLDAFVTAVDIKTCRFCGFVRACPGPLAVAQ
jgi:DNA helicase-2/ATP-dependent DNA helicase PcrA